MHKVVIDTSVLLALINDEPGKEKAAEIIPHSIMSSVNVAETASILVTRFGVPSAEVKKIIQKLVGDIIHFDEEQAYATGEINLISHQLKVNLSLGDRACLALAQSVNAKVYTADRPWKNLKIKNLEIEFIR